MRPNARLLNFTRGFFANRLKRFDMCYACPHICPSIDTPIDRTHTYGLNKKLMPRPIGCINRLTY